MRLPFPVKMRSSGVFTTALALIFMLFTAPVMAQQTWGATSGDWATEKAPLPEDQAFQVEAIKTSEGALVRMTPANGYYIYQDRTRFSDEGGTIEGRWPKGEIHDDPHFGPTPIHRQQVEITLDLNDQKAGTLVVNFQGCQDKGICYPPMSRTLDLGLGNPEPASAGPFATQTVETSQPVGLAQDEQWVQNLATKPTWWLLGAFLLGGLALSFTPCVLPMVPVVLGLVAPEQKGKKAFGLALAYVLSHALVLAIAGVIGAALGGGAGLTQLAQQPIILVGSAVIFTALGLWQAGWLRISLGGRLGAPLQHATARLPKGRLWGTIALGAGSAAILGPCVAPLTAGALIFVAQSGSPLLGGGVLFMMGLGMGIPLLAMAAGAGHLVPKTGIWMTHLSLIAAMGLFAVAAILLDRATGQQATLWWGLAWGVASVGLWIPAKTATWGAAPAAVLMLVIALASWTLFPSKETRGASGLEFETVSAQELEKRLKQGKPILLDLSADWCSSCLTMEKTTFADKHVASAAQSFEALRLNLDEIDADEQAFLKSYGLIGPPAVLFFDAQGQENRQARLVGPESAIAFIQRINRISSMANNQEKPAKEG
jgi:thiol:disulfide interchange protein DsbD